MFLELVVKYLISLLRQDSFHILLQGTVKLGDKELFGHHKIVHKH